jgi:hypothetical protein
MKFPNTMRTERGIVGRRSVGVRIGSINNGAPRFDRENAARRTAQSSRPVAVESVARSSAKKRSIAARSMPKTVSSLSVKSTTVNVVSN